MGFEDEFGDTVGTLVIGCANGPPVTTWQCVNQVWVEIERIEIGNLEN